MNNHPGLTKVIVTASSLVLAGLSGCAGGSGTSGGGGPSRGDGASGANGASGDWYYHWNCNGDPECVALTTPGQGGLDGPSGTHDEGPVYANCSVLLTFASINWNIPPATNSCDHSPTDNGTSGTGGGAGVGGTTSNGGALGNGGMTSNGGALGAGGTTSNGGALGSGGATAVCVLSACPACAPAGAACGGGDLRCCTALGTCGCCVSAFGLRCE